MQTLLRSIALNLIYLSLAQPSPAPFQVQWNTKTFFGPDGPWQAVPVNLGTADPPSAADSFRSSISLYPGGTYGHTILTTAFCNSSTSCPASSAGLYNQLNSPSSDNHSVSFQSGIDQWDGKEAMNLTGAGIPILDTITITSAATSYPIPKSIFTAVDSSVVSLPDNSFYSTQVGFLSLGAPNLAQKFNLENGSAVVANLLTGWLKQNNVIPSSSWGLHIGSVTQGQTGSLILGGFDQSRVLGLVGAFDTTGKGDEPIVPLLDITIGMVTGGSPFTMPVDASLFRAGGNISVPTIINPTIPYMYLPFGTCEAIAAYLPVTWQSSIGLYTWNINDPQYRAIIASPAYLGFIFQLSATANLTIKVPFALLNLTLEMPIVTRPQPYFPCKPFSGPSGHYFLGRAFLQATFIGLNWELNKFFMAQAPGPDAGPSQIQSIQSSDNTVASNPIDFFAGTWTQKWTNKIPSTSGTASPAPDPGMRNGTKIGIGVGSAVGALVLIGVLAAVIVASKRKSRNTVESQPPPSYGSEKPLPEIHSPERRRFEMEVPERVHEVGLAEVPELDNRGSMRSYRGT